MGKSRLWLVVGSTLALLASTPAVAAAQTVTGSWATKWFVEFESPPAADGTSAATLTRERDRFRDAARASGVSYKQRFAYTTLFNGISVSADADAAGELRNLDGVSAVYPVSTAKLDQTASAFEPDLAFAVR